MKALRPRQKNILRDQERSGQNQQRMFVGPVEQQGCDDRAEQSAEHAPERHQEIETGEMADGRTNPEHLPMKSDGHRKQEKEAESRRKEGISAAIAESEAAGDEDDHRGCSGDDRGRAAPCRKGDDEAEQIEAQRERPQKRHCNDIGSEVGRRRQHQARGHGGKDDPVEHFPDRRRRALFLRNDLDGIGRNGEGAYRDQKDQGEIGAGPEPALLLDRQHRLDDQGIGDEACKASEIGGCIKRIGIPAARLERIPALHERRLGRNDEEERPDRTQKEPGHPESGLAIDRRKSSAEADRKPQGRKSEHGEMEPDLLSRPEPRQPVRIGIAAEQEQLVDQHRAVPDGGRAADPWKRHPRNHRLSQEKEERAEDDRQQEEWPSIALVHASAQSGRLAIVHAPISLAATGA